MEKFDLSNIGKRLRTIREGLGLTQAEFSKKVRMSQSAISQFEDGKRIPTIKALEKITSALKISINELCVTEESENIRSKKSFAINEITTMLEQADDEDVYELRRFIGKMVVKRPDKDE